jgi:hypothetical protein
MFSDGSCLSFYLLFILYYALYKVPDHGCVHGYPVDPRGCWGRGSGDGGDDVALAALPCTIQFRLQ